MNRNSFTNLYPVTSFLLLINVGFFVLQMIEEHLLSLNRSVIMQDLGAIHGDSICRGQYWRLISGTFLHGGLFHVAMNCWILSDLGSFCEPRLSKSKFFSIYILSALGGSIASYSWPAVALTFDSGLNVSLGDAISVLSGQNPPSVEFDGFGGHLSVGCSGALAGLIGLMLVYSIKERHAALRSGMLKWIFFIAVFTYFWPNVDHAGHLGGLVVGGICGLTMADYATSRTSLRWRIPAGLTGLAMVWALAMAVYNFGNKYWFSN